MSKTTTVSVADVFARELWDNGDLYYRGYHIWAFCYDAEYHEYEIYFDDRTWDNVLPTDTLTFAPYPAPLSDDLLWIED